MDIPSLAKRVLRDLADYLCNLPSDLYQHALPIFSGSSLGQHTRHVVEFFECLQAQSELGYVDYDLRRRDLSLETSTELTVQHIDSICAWLSELSEDQALHLRCNHELQGEAAAFSVPSSLWRELLYNVEHAIHHMAILKIGTLSLRPDWPFASHFGVAPSTLRHQALKA